MLTIIQFNDISSSFILFGTSSRETRISKCVLNMHMRIAIYLNVEKYPCSCRVGSFIGTLKKLKKFLLQGEKRPLHYKWSLPF